MSRQDAQMKWVLFWVFLILFVIMVLGTLGMVFFDFGSPTESERNLMVKGLILEVAACIITLFYSIFRLKKGGEVPELFEGQMEEVKTEITILRREVDQLLVAPNNIIDIQPNSDKLFINRESSYTDPAEDFQIAIKTFDVDPPFPSNEYKFKPLPEDIDKDISSAKPFDKKHREEAYKGIKVQWKVRFYSISEDLENYSIVADFGVMFSKVRFKLKKSQGQRFQIENKGRVFWLCGSIVKVEASDITLEDASVEFGN